MARAGIGIDLIGYELIVTRARAIKQRRGIVIGVCQRIPAWQLSEQPIGDRQFTLVQRCDFPGLRHWTSTPRRMQLVATANMSGRTTKAGIRVMAATTVEQRFTVQNDNESGQLRSPQALREFVEKKFKGHTV